MQRASLLDEPTAVIDVPDDSAEKDQLQAQNEQAQVEQTQNVEVDEVPRRHFSDGRGLEFERESKGNAAFLLILVPIAALVAIAVGLLFQYGGLP